MSNFEAEMAGKAKRGELPLMLQEPSAETKGMYHWAVRDPATGRIVVGVGSTYAGRDFSWAKEISPLELPMYVDAFEDGQPLPVEP